jgi:hypothetical protein
LITSSAPNAFSSSICSLRRTILMVYKVAVLRRLDLKEGAKSTDRLQTSFNTMLAHCKTNKILLL